MVIKKRFVHVVSIKNGGIYCLDTEKIKKEPGMWQTYIPETKEKPSDAWGEETENRVGDELSHKELKALLTAASVEFKGNASKEELTQLFEGTL